MSYWSKCLNWYSSRPTEEQCLVKWASSRLHDSESLEKMVDPGIKRTFSIRAVSSFADIVSLCVQVFTPLANYILHQGIKGRTWNYVQLLVLFLLKFFRSYFCRKINKFWVCDCNLNTACEGIPTTNVRSCGIPQMSATKVPNGEIQWSRWYRNWWEIFPFYKHALHKLTCIKWFINSWSHLTESGSIDVQHILLYQKLTFVFLSLLCNFSLVLINIVSFCILIFFNCRWRRRYQLSQLLYLLSKDKDF